MIIIAHAAVVYFILETDCMTSWGRTDFSWGFVMLVGKGWYMPAWKRQKIIIHIHNSFCFVFVIVSKNNNYLENAQSVPYNHLYSESFDNHRHDDIIVGSVCATS